MITATAARSLAYWLSLNHPQIFAALAKQAQVGRTRKKLSGLGCDCGPCRGQLGQDDTALFNPDPSVATFDTPASDTASTFTFDTVDPTSGGTSPYTFTVDPTTTFVNPTVDATIVPEVPASPADLTAPAPSTGTAPATNTSPSVLSTVASSLLSPQVLTSVVNLGAAYFRSTAAASNATAAQAVLATQVGRVYSGRNPAAISYAVNPVTGQLTPVVSSPGGATFPATPQLLSSLGGSAAGLQIQSFVSQYGLYIGAALVLLLVARR